MSFCVSEALQHSLSCRDSLFRGPVLQRRRLHRRSRYCNPATLFRLNPSAAPSKACCVRLAAKSSRRAQISLTKCLTFLRRKCRASTNVPPLHHPPSLTQTPNQCQIGHRGRLRGCARDELWTPGVTSEIFPDGNGISALGEENPVPGG